MSSQNNKYLLAVSGGVDSCVLFDIFIKKNYDFIVIHFNHNTRGADNLIEETHVKNICQKNSIEYYTYHYNHKDGNFQSTARNFRIQKYKELIVKHNLKGVVLAHHLDDNFENIRVFKDKYFNLMEKVSRYENLTIYRPLINNSKKEIYQYASENGVIYFEDSSNKSGKYIRNYHRLNNVNLADEIKKHEVKKALQTQKYYRRTKIGSIITKEQFMKAENKKFLIFLLIKQNFADLDVKNKSLESIVKAIDFQGNKKFDVGKKVQIIQEYEKIYIKKKVERKIVNQQKLVIGINEFNGLQFENKHLQGFIRTRKSTDKIILKNGSKKVSRYMIDNKIPSEKREIYPVVVNEKDEVLYIPKIIKK